MSCPKCGAKVKGIALVVGLVKVTTKNCKCGRGWRVRELMIEFSVSRVEDELQRLLRRCYGEKTAQVKGVIHYLQSKLDDHAASKLERDVSTRKRRMDMEERRFLQEALQEVY